MHLHVDGVVEYARILPYPAIVLLCTSSGNRYLPDDGDEGGAEVLQSTHPSLSREEVQGGKISG